MHELPLAAVAFGGANRCDKLCQKLPNDATSTTARWRLKPAKVPSMVSDAPKGGNASRHQMTDKTDTT